MRTWGKTHAEFLRQAGYVADRVHDEGLSGASDNDVWRRICTEGRFLITLDLDFSDVRKHPVGSHSGILLLRPRSRGRGAVLDVLERVVKERPLHSLSGCLAVADETHTRIRAPQDPDQSTS